MQSKALAQHIEGHVPHTDFDYYCIAHGSDYQPKYLEVLGDICHDGYDESYCSDNCNRCPVKCPIPFCNTKDDPYFAEYWEDAEV